MKAKVNWRFRKGSEANPIKSKSCGCLYYVYDNTIVRYCEKHELERKQAERRLTDDSM